MLGRSCCSPGWHTPDAAATDGKLPAAWPGEQAYDAADGKLPAAWPEESDPMTMGLHNEATWCTVDDGFA